MKYSKNNLLKLILIIINLITILISSYKIIIFISKVGNVFFTWWLPMGKIFSYIHFWHFVTFFIIPLPFGFYFITLILYFFIPIFLMVKIQKNINLKYVVFSLILLVGVLGNFIILIGE